MTKKECEFKVNGVCECSDCWQFGEECYTSQEKCDFLNSYLNDLFR